MAGARDEPSQQECSTFLAEPARTISRRLNESYCPRFVTNKQVFGLLAASADRARIAHRGSLDGGSLLRAGRILEPGRAIINFAPENLERRGSRLKLRAREHSSAKKETFRWLEEFELVSCDDFGRRRPRNNSLRSSLSRARSL